MRRYTVMLGCMVLLWAAVFLSYTTAAGRMTLKHIHGLSFSADGTQLFIPSHHGLTIYSKNGWSQAPGPRHDYMGFAVTREFFYSSGHPAPGSLLRNPFGLIKSRDGGHTWEQLGLTGESDFHLLATSYETNTVYVFNSAANSRMPSSGLYYTTDDGKRWQRAKGAGLRGRLLSLAVHPSQGKVMAIGTQRGLYLSQDSGARFQRVTEGIQVLAVFFAFDGRHLWFSGFTGRPTLTRMHWQTQQTESVGLPAMDQDKVTYIAQNPVNPQMWAIATNTRAVYISSDNCQTWTQIAKRGETR